MKTHENGEGTIWLTLRTRNPKKPSRMLVRSWKNQWLLLCPVNYEKELWEWWDPTKFRQNLRVLSKLMNLRDCVREIRCRMIIKTNITGKGENSLQQYNMIHKFIPMPQAMKIPTAKEAVDKEWEKLEKFSAWNLTKVRSKKEVIDEARSKGAKVHLASLMDRHLSSERCWIGAKTPEIQRSSCSPRWYCKR